MTQLSTSNINAVADLKPGYTLGAADVALLQEMARRLLAVEGQNPVGTFRKGPCGYYPSFHEDAVLLYDHAAPQPAPVAPPVQVPECFVRFHQVIKDRHHGRMPEEVQNAFDECAAMLEPRPVAVADVPDGWNACRAAMLKGDKS